MPDILTSAVRDSYSAKRGEYTNDDTVRTKRMEENLSPEQKAWTWPSKELNHPKIPLLDVHEYDGKEELIPVDDARLKLVFGQLCDNIFEPYDDTIHGGTVGRSFQNHIVNQRAHKIESIHFLHELGPDQVAHTIHIGVIWIAWFGRILKLGNRPVSTNNDGLSGILVFSGIVARQPKINEVVFDGTLCTSVVLCQSSPVPLHVEANWMIWFSVQGRSVHHDVVEINITMGDIVLVHEPQADESLPEELHGFAEGLESGIIEFS